MCPALKIQAISHMYVYIVCLTALYVSIAVSLLVVRVDANLHRVLWAQFLYNLQRNIYHTYQRCMHHQCIWCSYSHVHLCMKSLRPTHSHSIWYTLHSKGPSSACIHVNVS